MKKIKIARVVTIPFSMIPIMHLLENIDSHPKFQLYIVCSEGEFLPDLRKRLPNTRFEIIYIPREINLLKDLSALIKLMIFLWREKIDILHSHTPKAGLISAIAGWLSFRPVRIHTYTGQVWSTMSGIKRNLFVFIDKAIFFLNTVCFTDSIGQKKFLIQNNIGYEEKLIVLGNGSFGGYDLLRFNRSRCQEDIDRVRSQFFPKFNGIVISFLGRLNEEKGIVELYTAFKKLKMEFDVKLLLVGPKDVGKSQAFFDTIHEIELDQDVVCVKYTSEPEIYLGVGDIFCFPSYREGCANVVFEASLMELPVVASQIYGVEDSVVENVTGYFFESKNIEQMIEKLKILILDRHKRIDFGIAGSKRVREHFSQELLTKLMIDEYLKFNL